MKMSTLPSYEEMMHPTLVKLSNGKEHSISDIMADLVETFTLDESALRLRSSGGKSVLYNRAGWARTYLKKAGLIDNPKKGIYVITERGLKVLQSGKKVNNVYLEKFSPFKLFRKPDRRLNKQNEKMLPIPLTPEELLETEYIKIREFISQDLLIRIKQASPYFFEKLVIDLLLAMGYGGSRKDAGKAFRKGHDEGVDGIIYEDRLGLDVVYVQAKCWENSVGRPEIQKFIGALQGKRAKKGVFITTSSFTKEADNYAKNLDCKIVLIDGQQLCGYMQDYNVGVNQKTYYEIKTVDSDYFDEN